MGSFLSFLLGQRKTSAKVAKERLQIILAHERVGRRRQPGYLTSLQRELGDVVCKYIKIDPKDIKATVERQKYRDLLKVNVERQENLDVLEVKIEVTEAR